MNKSLRKFLLELGPLLLFFITYRKSGMNHGIIMLIMTTTLSVIISYILEKKIPIIAIIGAAFIAVFGGLAIYFNNKKVLYGAILSLPGAPKIISRNLTS